MKEGDGDRVLPVDFNSLCYHLNHFHGMIQQLRAWPLESPHLTPNFGHATPNPVTLSDFPFLCLTFLIGSISFILVPNSWVVVRVKQVNMKKVLRTISGIVYSLNKCWLTLQNSKSTICWVRARIMRFLLPPLTCQIIDKCLSILLCQMKMVFTHIAC